MAKIKRNCDKCSNKIGDNYCTMHKDMNKAMNILCDGFKVLPKPIKKVILSPEIKPAFEADEEKVGTEFYRFLNNGGHYDLNKVR